MILIRINAWLAVPSRICQAVGGRAACILVAGRRKFKGSHFQMLEESCVVPRVTIKPKISICACLFPPKPDGVLTVFSHSESANCQIVAHVLYI